ncbi:2,3-dimethylmalate lyase [Actinacidiphila yanglinensis]|uniref:2-methylisocitrate lyase n=1 Tax=Actinacidiphila yanglinensis TaxID=310779 RepID=A0A1H6C671_9ACTN|nr:isocitrate lyase/PEP mutase family protein [Actinacidiphila yanglinensis]SEG68454.1 2,3-dimethylmalate lyase [Actinacidiphila yanglinensis]
MSDLLNTGPSGPRRLRELLAGDDPVPAAGAYDALSARLVEQAGFPAVYMTGFGASASLIGRPDVGLLTMTEMAGAARRIVSAVGVPVVADADTGYGNALNVVRTVQEYEAAGVAALHLEDQQAPKRCGHLDGKSVVPAAEMAGKIEAAVAARRDPDLVIIARTDARAVEGFDAALERARRYRDCGADLLFVEALRSEEEIEATARALPDVPLLFNWVESGRTPPMGMERLRELGYRMVIFPVSALLAATRAVQDTLSGIVRDGTPPAGTAADRGLPGFFDTIGLPDVLATGSRYDHD